MGKIPKFVFSVALPSAAGVIVLVVLVMSACGPDILPSKKLIQRDIGEESLATNGYGAELGVVPSKYRKDASSLLREVRVYKDFIPRGQHGRKYIRRMNPRYITVHSTQNFALGADAWRHSLALKNGKLRSAKKRGGNRIGYLVWHYTIDDTVAVQHLPTNEQGEHADFDGPGNHYSIGLEMCEHHGSDREKTIDRTAKLIAYLMFEKSIPLKNVVPHYHWKRKGLSTPHKNCPHFLMDNGKPGAKWNRFKARVKVYFDQITCDSAGIEPSGKN